MLASLLLFWVLWEREADDGLSVVCLFMSTFSFCSFLASDLFETLLLFRYSDNLSEMAPFYCFVEAADLEDTDNALTDLLVLI